MRKGTHIVGAFARAMGEGRIEDGVAILEEMRMPDGIIGIALTHYYDPDADLLRSNLTGALLERFAGW